MGMTPPMGGYATLVEVVPLPRKRSRLMSEALKRALAQEMGVAAVVDREGWGSVSARECGRLVQRAMIRAQEALARNRGA